MKYLDAIKQIDQLKDYPMLTNEDGKIILGGRRWSFAIYCAWLRELLVLSC